MYERMNECVCTVVLLYVYMCVQHSLSYHAHAYFVCVCGHTSIHTRRQAAYQWSKAWKEEEEEEDGEEEKEDEQGAQVTPPPPASSSIPNPCDATYDAAAASSSSFPSFPSLPSSFYGDLGAAAAPAVALGT